MAEDDDDFGLTFAMRIRQRQKEGIPDDTILSLSSFEQLVLS